MRRGRSREAAVLHSPDKKNRRLRKHLRVVDLRQLAMLDSVEPFFLARGHDLAVDNQCRGQFVKYRVDSEYVQPAALGHWGTLLLDTSHQRYMRWLPRPRRTTGGSGLVCHPVRMELALHLRLRFPSNPKIAP